MCRFVAYMGQAELISDIAVKPSNSLVKQSLHAQEGDHPTNADGFGLGWYQHDIDNQPGIFHSFMPAWNNLNLINLANKVKSKCFFAHVRAASQGGVGLTNCHPFAFQDVMLMHNGTVHGFAGIKRQLRRELDDDIYDWIHGQTDSEHFFALFLQTMRNEHLTTTNINSFYQCLQITIVRLMTYLRKYDSNPQVFLNIAVTDGFRTLVSRFTADPKQTARTLYFAVGDKFIFEHGEGHMYPVKETPNAVLVSSEKLTKSNFEWHEVTQNHCVLIDSDLSTTMVSMENA